MKYLLCLALCCANAWAGEHRLDEPTWFSQGKAVTNSTYPLLESSTWGFAQDFDYTDQWLHGKLRVGYVNEGIMIGKNSAVPPYKRDGIYGEWVGTKWLTSFLAVEGSIGPYITATTVPDGDRNYRDDYKLSAIFGAALRLELFSHVNVMFSWQRPTYTRVNSHYTDVDCFSVWIGIR